MHMAKGMPLLISDLGYLYMRKGQLHDSKEMFEKATDFHNKAQSVAYARWNAEGLSAVITQIKEGGSTKDSTK